MGDSDDVAAGGGDGSAYISKRGSNKNQIFILLKNLWYGFSINILTNMCY